ncbi:MAG: hypothetical protein VX587_03220 [Thermoproteota archaeon]|nr:hypothetical protein [Thermoproteota archaeon]
MNPKKNFLNLCSVIFSILLLFGFIPNSFSESELKTVSIFVEPPSNVQSMDNEKTNDEKNNNPAPTPTLPQELPTAFVTGNDYAINNNQILISSNEGIALNNLLIEQIDEWKNDVEHTENFWSRTDQVIMGNFGVINALQNPLTNNNYHIDGKKSSENVKSNLEYFVQERGYDVDNLENVPNHMVTPKKYDLSRSVSKQWENPLSNNLDIQHVRDLRDIAPNAFDFTPEQEMQMFRQSIKTTSFEVVGSLMPRLIVDESMFLPESDSTRIGQEQKPHNDGKESLESSIYDTEQKQSQKQNKESEAEIFQQTSHIKDMISSYEFEPNYSVQEQQVFPLFEIITSLLISSGSVVFWILLKKYYKRNVANLSTITEKIKSNYLDEAESLLQQADSLYKKAFIKDAYEKLSQSMRLFYSNKLGLEKEVITSDLIPLMKNFTKSEKSLVRNSLHLSDMIEFAKHTDDKKQFAQILEEFSQIIQKEKI